MFSIFQISEKRFSVFGAPLGGCAPTLSEAEPADMLVADSDLSETGEEPADVGPRPRLVIVRLPGCVRLPLKRLGCRVHPVWLCLLLERPGQLVSARILRAGEPGRRQ